MSVIEDIKAKVEIVDLVGETVTLKKAGRNFKANCPFHSERTPSFTVSPERQTWHCFGSCGVGGDIFGFVQRRDGIAFGDALRLLAERAGIQLEPRAAASDERYERLYAANEAAATFFQNRLLTGEDAAAPRAYVDQRGVDDATIRAFRLGYAPEGWDTLRAHLERRGFTATELLAAGLLVESDRGGYDRFRGRVIFPIADERGRVIGFGGRTLGDDTPKYLNTAQTDIFDKGRVVYALDRAKESIRKDGAVIVEGYMDTIAAHQFGYTNVVASMGTALTERQVNILKRFTRNLILALDADAAGSEATLRGIQVVVDASDRESIAVPDWRGLVRYQEMLACDIHIVALPHGKDPDNVIREQPGAWSELIASARPVVEHLLSVARERFDVSDPRGRSKMVETLLPALADVGDPVVRAHYLQRLATLARIPESELQNRLRQRSQPGPRRPATERTATATPQAPAPPNADGARSEFLLALLYLHPSLRAQGLALDAGLFWDTGHRRLFEAWRAQPEPPDEGSEERAVFERLSARRLPPYDSEQAGEAFNSALKLLGRGRLLEAKRNSTATLTEEAESFDQKLVIEEAMTARDGTGPQGDGVGAMADLVLRDLDAGMRLHGVDVPRGTVKTPVGVADRDVGAPESAEAVIGAGDEQQ